MNNVSSGYFATMGIPLREGRAFARGDTAGAPLTAIVNRTAAERYWPGRSPIGRHLRLRSDGPPIEIVGVARDSKSLFVNEGPRPFVYFPLEQQFRPQVNLALHTAGDPAAMASAARQAFHAIDPELTVFDVKTMETHLQLGQAYFFMRLAATLATVVGLIGLVQTMVGLYGVIAYGVAQRTREFGIRMALGALPRDVIGGVLRRGLVMAATGVAIGVLLSLLITSAMAGLLVGVGAHDPLTFVAAAGALLLLALLSTFVPAWRAARLAPLAALRED
jgi:predicted permease